MNVNRDYIMFVKNNCNSLHITFVEIKYVLMQHEWPSISAYHDLFLSILEWGQTMLTTNSFTH